MSTYEEECYKYYIEKDKYSFDDEKDFCGADLSGCDLSGARLRRADFTKAKLKGTNLKGATLIQADLIDADLSEANLEGADLSQANLWNTKFVGANLSEAELGGTYQSHPDIDAYEAELGYFQGNISQLKSRLNFSRANLNDACLEGADLSDSVFQYANLRGANLKGTSLYEADLSSATLIDADLEGANLAYAHLDYANLIDANLKKATLCKARLAYADLKGANLGKADLNLADFYRADLRGANWEGAKWTNAYFGGSYINQDLQLVINRNESRTLLLEALDKTEEFLIIVCPWLTEFAIDRQLLEKFRVLLKRGSRIAVGWGYLGDLIQDDQRQVTLQNLVSSWKYKALPMLKKLEQTFPGQVELKLLGTHEKYFVCDRKFAVLGSHNILTSNAKGEEREIGLRISQPWVIANLIDRFVSAQPWELKEQ